MVRIEVFRSWNSGIPKDVVRLLAGTGIREIEEARSSLPKKQQQPSLDDAELAKLTKTLRMLATGRLQEALALQWAEHVTHSGAQFLCLRIRSKKHNPRVFLTTQIGDAYWILSAYKKKDQKIPKKELDRAMERLRELESHLKERERDDTR